MKCAKYFLCCYLIVSVICEVGSIKNYPIDKNQISQEDRRGAEKLEDGKPTKLFVTESFENKKRGLSLEAKYRQPGSLLYPTIGLGYARKKPNEDEGYESHRTASVLATSRPQYSITDSRGGYIGNYPNSYSPGEYYGGGFSHTGGGTYEHSGGGIGGGGSFGGGSLGGGSLGGGYGGGGYGGGGYGGGGYGGGGYEYPAYGPPSTGVGHPSGGGGGGFKNPVGFKKLLLPLAGLALLGAAAALTVNPVLLQLGVINGRRRRRGLIQFNNDVYPANPFIQPHEN